LGKFVFAPGDGSIWIQDAVTRQASPLVKAQAEVYADSPSFTMDGEQVVYMLTTIENDRERRFSIHLMDSDGNNDRILVKPDDLTLEVNWPTISPDGKWLLLTAMRDVQPDGERSEIYRLPVGGGAAEKVIDNARSAVFSPEGNQIAFLRFNGDTFGSALWIANSDGSDPKRLLADDAFLYVSSPRFSPDGGWILFAAAGPPYKALPTGSRLRNAPCEPQILCMLAQPAFAHGLPWDLWVVSVDGKHFHQLTLFGFDSPTAAWSRDGKAIGIFGASGIYILDLERRGLSQFTSAGGHGGFDWWMPTK
jgi:Tol biopolymer transport system component